jgi:hypothetical protein
MKRKPLLKDADGLVALAESIAAVLSEKRDGISGAIVGEHGHLLVLVRTTFFMGWEVF